MEKKIIAYPMGYPIQPKHIDASQQLYEAFGDGEKEIAAMWIVRFCQKLGGWGPFYIGDLAEFFTMRFGFSGLDEDGFIVIKGEQCTVTHEFVARCFLSSPVIPSQNGCPACGSEDLKMEEGSIVDGGLVRHQGGTAYLQCQQCGSLIVPNTHELVKV